MKENNIFLTEDQKRIVILILREELDKSRDLFKAGRRDRGSYEKAEENLGGIINVLKKLE